MRRSSFDQKIPVRNISPFWFIEPWISGIASSFIPRTGMAGGRGCTAGLVQETKASQVEAAKIGYLAGGISARCKCQHGPALITS